MSTSRAVVPAMIDAGAEPERELLMFAYYFPPANTSGAQRPFRFAKNLQTRGYTTHVVTQSGHGSACAWRHVMETPAGGRPWADAASSIVRTLEHVLPYKDQLPWIPRAIAVAGDVIKRGKISAVFSTSPPVGTHLAALWCKRRFDIPWIADFRDPICANPFRTARRGIVYDRALERVIVSNADIIVANTNGAADSLRNRYPHWASKMHVIWNGFDPDEQLSALPIPVRAQKVLLHAGSIYGGRHPGQLLGSVRRLIERGIVSRSEFRLRLIGSIDPGDPWIAASGFEGLVAEGWVEHTDDHLPRQQAIHEMAEADGLLLLDLNDLGAGVQVPAKLFEYLRIGRPILAYTAVGSGADSILANAGVPNVRIYNGSTESEMDENVHKFLQLPNEPVSANAWFRQHFDVTKQTETLANLLGTLKK